MIGIATRGALLGSLVLATAARAEQGASTSIAAGRQLAQSICGTCHVVTDDPRQGASRPPGPNLVAVARRPSFSEASLRTRLASGHGLKGQNGAPVPAPLTDAEIGRIVAYLASLRSAD